MDHLAAGRLLATLTGRAGAEPALARLFDAVGGWPGLYGAGPGALAEALGAGGEAPARALFSLVDAWLAEASLPEVVDGPEHLARILRPRLALEQVEAFWVVSLDARARITGLDRISTGTLTACLVHPREVFAPALRARAASVVVVHNHPSGDPEPSSEDMVLTERLTSAGRLLGIPVVDHVVVARGGVRSLIGAEAA
jgi:DNA repair protein RadC